MYRIVLEIVFKQNTTLKESYENLAKLIRLFIRVNNKELKKKHYQSIFSYYTFSNLFPSEEGVLFKKDKVYQVEVRSMHEDFLDLKKFTLLETESVILIGVNAGKLYFHPCGLLKSEILIFLNEFYKEINNIMIYMLESIEFQFEMIYNDGRKTPTPLG